jgi:hypothetical protein
MSLCSTADGCDQFPIKIFVFALGTMQAIFTLGPAVTSCAVHIMKNFSRSGKQQLQVILGSQTIKAFVAAPKEFRVIGIVRMGMEFGLLALTASGNYVRVNGSVIQPLSNRVVEDAIGVARMTGRGESYATTRQHAALVVPTVMVRRRRRLMHEAGEVGDTRLRAAAYA